MKNRRRFVWVLALTGAVVILAVNVVAYRQARCMTRFTPIGTRTASPEKLTLWQRALVILNGVELPKPQNVTTPASYGLRFTTTMVTTRDGLRLELWDIPAADEKAELVLMFHGYGCSKAALLAEAKLFCDLGQHLVLVDHRGSGGSDGETTTLGWREALDVAAVADWAQKRWPGRRILLFGQSMGAVAALRAVQTEGVQPAGMILECPFDTLVHTVGNRFRAMGLPPMPLAELLVFWGGVQNGMNGFQHDATMYARAVQCPVLLLCGEKDARVTRSEFLRVAAQIQGKVKTVVLPGVGHQSYCRATPELYRRTVSEWLVSTER